MAKARSSFLPPSGVLDATLIDWGSGRTMHRVRDAAYAANLFSPSSTGNARFSPIRDEAGARWRFVEHRQDPPLLPPGTSWMQGAAGIAAFLLRLARVIDNGLDAPVVDRPDQWWAVPGRLRTACTHRDVLPDLP